MPILRVQALPQRHPELISGALKTTCLAIAEIYGCRPDQVWATWVEIPPGLYVEGTEAANLQPAASHPPIAELTCFEGRSAAQIEELLLTASRTLTDALGISGNIFMTYVEALAGRVVAGNGVVRRARREG